MKTRRWFQILIATAFLSAAYADGPSISNVWAAQRSGTKIIEIMYDLSDPGTASLNVGIEVFMFDGAGGYFLIPSVTFAGMGYGSSVIPGIGKNVQWDAGTDWDGSLSTGVWFKVKADDSTTSGSRTNAMMPVPAGVFQMGGTYSDSVDAPLHNIYVSDFLVARYEVSNDEFRRVMQWAYNSGLLAVMSTPTFTKIKNVEGIQQTLIHLDAYSGNHAELSLSSGIFYVAPGRENFPVVHVTWHGAQAYCNFRSEMEGLDSCINFTDWNCDFGKNGYRLPTEAEWEKAARGGLDGHHFPWPSYGGTWQEHIDGSKANYSCSGDPYESGAEPKTTPVGYYDGEQLPPGVDMANGYGLYDMAGNVSEWCYDWYSSSYYSISPSTDPTGPATGEAGGFDIEAPRVRRGGSWAYYDKIMSAKRSSYYPSYGLDLLGFRIARRDPNADMTIQTAACGEASSIYGPITIDTTGTNTPGIIQFNTTSATADANAGSVTLSVMRLGGTLGTATVDYATTDGTALAGTDYTSATGTLHWADGDNTNRIITVSISSNSSASENKTFSVLLSNPTGASLGDYTNATVTIISASNRTPVYRLYSYGQPDSTYEHVWTTDWNEMAIMSTAYGWTYEGVAWHAFSDYVQGTTPLYRLYAPSIRQHHYTMNATEYYILTEQSGGAWNGEGIQYFVYPDDSVPGTTPVYRFYHAGMGLHHFTIDAGEAAVIQATPGWGYVYEDIAFYVYPAE